MPTLTIEIEDGARSDYDVNYEVCPMKNSSYSVSGSRTERDFRTSATITQSYRVYIPELQVASDLTDPQVGCLPELPTVNVTPYVNSNTGYTNPYAIARSKRVTRNATNSKLWEVTVDFSYSELLGEECEAAPPANVEDIPPVWTFEQGSIETVAYEDIVGEQCFKLPTGTHFENPMMRKEAVTVITITQFEDHADDWEITAQDRSFKCNQALWYGYERYAAMTGAVQFTEQKVLTQAGYVDAIKAVYRVSIASGLNVLNEDGVEVAVKHQKIQPLIDLWYMDGDGNKLESVSEGEAAEPISVLIDGNGEKLPSQLGKPRYLLHKIQPEIQFTFLRDKP